MKEESADKDLSRVLKEWRVGTQAPPGFQDAVWRRIEKAEKPVPSIWEVASRWIASVLPRPAMAVGYVAVLLAIGLTAGWSHARQENALVRDQLGNRYIQTIDPYAMPR